VPYLYKRCSCPIRYRCSHPFWYEFELRGERHRGTTRTADRRFAERIRTKRRNGVIAKHEGVSPPDRPTLPALIRDYGDVTQGEHKTWKKTCAVLRSFELFARGRALEQIDAFAIEQWRAKRVAQVSRSTANREMNVIRGLFKRAVLWGRLAVSPVAMIKQLKIDEVPRRVLSPAEIRLVLDHSPAPLALIFRVTLESLSRLSEVLGLRREHVGDTWFDIRRKGGRVARIPISSDLRDRLLAHCHRSGWIFGSDDRDGAPPSQASVSAHVPKLMRRLNLPGVSHHTMRHTGTTMMLDAGISPRVVQYFGGWTTIRMVERYGHVRDAELRRAVSAMHELTNRALPTS
jgi:integrase